MRTRGEPSPSASVNARTRWPSNFGSTTGLWSVAGSPDLASCGSFALISSIVGRPNVGSQVAHSLGEQDGGQHLRQRPITVERICRNERVHINPLRELGQILVNVHGTIPPSLSGT